MILQTVPTLQAPSVNTFVESLIIAAMKGVRIYLTKPTVEKFKPLFDQLGLSVREVQEINTEGEYILLKLVGVKIDVEIHDVSKTVTRSFNTRSFMNALKSYIEKRKGKVSVSPLYELNIPEELIEKLKKGEKE